MAILKKQNIPFKEEESAWSLPTQVTEKTIQLVWKYLLDTKRIDPSRRH